MMLSVLDKGNACRGFGYVTFVMQEDAAKSLAAKIQIGTRKLQLSVADKKPRQRDNYKKKPIEGMSLRCLKNLTRNV